MRLDRVSVSIGTPPLHLSTEVDREIKPGDIVYLDFGEKGNPDFGGDLPNSFCDYCGKKIQVQIFKNSGACSGLHAEYEFWEEMFGETIA